MNSSDRTILITFDTDWAPDFAIDAVAEIIRAAGAKATFFVTHASSAVERLRAEPERFELGLHPNFFAGSTHGATPREVIAHCRALVPDAYSVRTHGFYMSSRLLTQIAAETDVRADLSFFHAQGGAPEPSLLHLDHGRRLVRLPTVWEDDMTFADPAHTCDGAAWAARRSGVTVANFHPLSSVLNTPGLQNYEEAKRRSPRLSELQPEQIEDLIHRGAGTGSFLRSLAAFAGQAGERCCTVREYVEEWLGARAG